MLQYKHSYSERKEIVSPWKVLLEREGAGAPSSGQCVFYAMQQNRA
jgi:hypothetical protein